MEDPVFKIKYKKYKYKVKLWEKSFKKKNGRIPSKHDIKDSPLEIRDSYRMYYKLKTSLLENTLNDVLDDDEDFDFTLDMSQSEANLSSQDLSQSGTIDNFSNLGEIRSANISISNLLTDQIKGRVSEFEAESTLKSNDNAWGRSLNMKKEEVPQKRASPKKKDKSKIQTKMMPIAGFSKRNPRKSFSRLSSTNLSSSFSSSSSSLKEILPDLETLLNEKSKQSQESASISNINLPSSTKRILNDVDHGWLNRCSSENGFNTHNSSTASDTTSNGPHKFGLKNINMSALDRGSLSSNLGETSTSFGLSSLSMTSNSQRERDSINSSGVAYSENIYDKQVESDSDGVIENSEDESTSVRHIVKKRKVFNVIDKNQIEEVKADIESIPEVVPIVENIENILNEKSTAKPVRKVVAKSTVKYPKKPLKKVKERLKDNGNVPANEDLPKKTLRRGRSAITYKENGSEEEQDPFSNGDDSDLDPDFKENEDKNQTEMPEEAEEVVESAPKQKRVRKVAVRKPKKESATSPSSKAIKKTAMRKSVGAPRIGGPAKLKKKAVRITKTKQNPNAMEETNLEEQPTEPFNEYVLEFGIESLNNAPRVNIKELQTSTQAFKNYVNSDALVAQKTNPSTSSSFVSPKSKKLIAMEKKVKAGKLNENFVQLNLRKKIFVRGHKTVNFSRYKKSLWKKKKAGALSGPEMDMGGCDGGVLTCFLCGGVGHFARNCKVKGEQLLPLDAEFNDSPFPTLEEAENMAKSKTLVVHANRMNNMPTVDNPTWKNTEVVQKEDAEVTQKEDAEVDPESEGVEDIEMEVNEIEPPEEEPVVEPDKKVYIGHAIPEDFLKKSGIMDFTVGNKDKIDALYKLNPDGSLPPTPPEVFEALKMFGHEAFRNGQEKAVMRVLCGQSTLVTLSTGSGKSLCYQLPAYLYGKMRRCVTLVISPLVSLMEDQVHGVPGFLNAQCLHTNQTPKVRERTMAAITSGELDVLLISPEAVVSGEKSTGFGSLLKQLPPIAFACIDEAHCVSQWSHNFRPSYLMICRVLKEKLGVQTILGLTATATVQTRESIVKHLGVPDGLNGIISDIPLPDNLVLTVSKDINRDAALLGLLRSERFSNLQSIIIYCTRRDECERISAFIRTCLQDIKPVEVEGQSKKRKRVNYNAEPYHAGMPSSRRRTIQNAFMCGDLRIVVATIAFGMGINKADIRAIIHYNMPKNFESYVQEVGRAGRDGETSHCHLFLDAKGSDRNELRRHIYANSIDRHVIRKLLQKIFVPCACAQNFKDDDFNEEHRKNIEALKDISWTDDFNLSTEDETAALSDNPKEDKIVPKQRICPGHEVCFSIESTVQLLDIPEENISTLLCYLELHEQRYINVLSRAYVMCKVMSYGGPKQLKLAAKECPPLAMAIALDLKKGLSHETSTFIEFPVIDVAAAIGWDSGVVKYQLKNLEWTGADGMKKRSAISVSFSNLGFRIRAPGDLTDDELDSNLDSLFERVTRQEKAQLIQLQCVFDALSSIAFSSYGPCTSTECPRGPSDKLKTIIRAYFQTNISNDDVKLVADTDDTPDGQLIGDIRTMCGRYPENNFSGRSIARIFHGVQSPNYPAVIWSRCNYWRAYTRCDFNRIVKLANSEIVRMRT